MAINGLVHRVYVEPLFGAKSLAKTEYFSFKFSQLDFNELLF